MAKKPKSSTPSNNPQKPTPPRARAATGRQRKYVNEVLKGKTKKEAKRKAGYSKNTAGVEIEAKPAVKQLFTETLDKLGVSDLLLGRRIYQGLFAMETKTATKDGKITDRVNLVDFGQRYQYTELGLKMRGHLIDKHEIRVGRLLEDILEDSHV